MDITCPRCSEPWYMDALHDAIDMKYPGRPWDDGSGTHNQTAYDPYYTAMSETFRTKGCGVAFADLMGELEVPCNRVDTDRTRSARLLYDLLGDDLDGAAAMLEDLAL